LSANILLEVNSLKTYFHNEVGLVKAVDNVSFKVKKGETLGIVGESGCGKSVTSLSIMNLVPQPRGVIEGGEIIYHGYDNPLEITTLNSQSRDMRNIRGNRIAMIFQEPMTSLNPVYTVGEQIMESVRLHQKRDNIKARARAIEMLKLVGLPAPEQIVDEYPHELSGGMRQRVMIGMALSCNPDLLIADEPTTALDVTIEAQILDLMEELQDEFNMSIMLITHDLEVIGEMSERVIVMYTGKIMEKANIDDIFHNSKHPYTQGLLNSIPQIGANKRLIPIEGSVPDLTDLPSGCYFAPRCNQAKEICWVDEPPEYSITEVQKAKCWLYDGKEELS